MKRVLVVDDEPTVVKTVQIMLEEAGYHVISASDGEMALEVMREKEPDLMILDITLPKLDGHQVCRQVRSDKKFRELPIIMFTGRGGVDEIGAGMDIGATAYVMKPFDCQKLMGIVGALI